MTGDFVPRRDDDGVVTAQFDGEAVLYQLEANRLHLLNGTAALVWQLCDGSGSVAELVDDLAATFDAPREEIATGVEDVIETFRSDGLLR